MTTKTERFELRLRPNIPAEADLLAELDALDGVYGGKTELLRECLRRGFTALNAAVETQPAAATEEEVLDHLASVFPSGEYSYRIGKLFVDARAVLRDGKGADLPVHKTQAPAQPVESSLAYSDPAQEEQVPQENQGGGALADPPGPGNPVGDREAESRPRPNWARFRGLAGSGDVKSGEN